MFRARRTCPASFPARGLALLIAFALLTAAACRPAATPTPTPTLVPTLEPPTATATASVTPAPTATSTPTSTPTATCTATATATPTSTETPAPTPTATSTSTPTVPNDLRLTALNYAGRDEYVEVTNHGPGAQDMTGWTIGSMGQRYPYRFPAGYVLPAGASVRVHSGPDAAANPPTDLRWSGSYFWNNDGDEATLYDAEGQLVDRRGY